MSLKSRWAWAFCAAVVSCAAQPPAPARPLVVQLPERQAAAPQAEAAKGCEQPWCWENPRPQGANLKGIWGSRRDDVWAVGEVGTILHFDGTSWNLVRSEGAALLAVHGISANDVWASGDGRLLHWDGKTWRDVPLPAENAGPLKSIRANASDDVWFGEGYSNRPIHLHWDGKTLAEATPASAPPPQIHAIWEASKDEAWGLTSDGVEHWSGGTWTSLTLPLPASPQKRWMHAVGGSGPDDVWVVGEQGSIFRFQDGAFRGLSLGVSDAWRRDLQDVWGSAANDVWIVGSRGDMFHYDGRAFTSVDDSTYGCNDAWLAEDGDGWAATDHGVLRRNRRGVWARTSVDLTPPLSSDDFTAVFGFASGEVLLGGDAGFVSFRDGVWERREQGLENLGEAWGRKWASIWGASPDDVWALGARGLAHWSGREWHVDQSLAASFPARLSGASANDIWLLLETELRHWNGDSWQIVTPETPGRWLDVWAAGVDDAWLVGTQGTASHWDGSSWTPVAVGAASSGGLFSNGQSLTAVGGNTSRDVWIATSGYLFHFDGNRWSDSAWQTEHHLTRLLTGPQRTTYAITSGGGILRHR